MKKLELFIGDYFGTYFEDQGYHFQIEKQFFNQAAQEALSSNKRSILLNEKKSFAFFRSKQKGRNNTFCYQGFDIRLEKQIKNSRFNIECDRLKERTKTTLRSLNSRNNVLGKIYCLVHSTGNKVETKLVCKVAFIVINVGLTND